MSPGDDLRFMQLALALGRRGLGNSWPNPAVGAVVVGGAAAAVVVTNPSTSYPPGSLPPIDVP